MPAMTERHRIFLQSFMSRGILDGREVKELFRCLCEKYDVEFDIAKVVEFTQTINTAIKPYHMEIKKGIDEHDGTNFYCLVNLQESDISRMATRYTAVELEYFKKLMEEIVCSTTEGCLSSTDALNLTEDIQSQGKVLKKRDAEQLIEKLCTERWLTRKEGMILLTPRTLMEFDHYLQEQYPDDSVQCELCHKLVVKGQNCSQCAVRMHQHCARKFFKPENPKCPRCGEPWTHDMAAAGKQAKVAKLSQREGPSQGANTSQGVRRSSRR